MKIVEKLLESGSIPLAPEEWDYGWGDEGAPFWSSRRATYNRYEINERPGGSYPPAFRDEIDHGDLRAACRVVAQVNGVGIGIMETLTNYNIGSGYTYTVEAESDVAIPPEMVKEVQRIVDEFLDENDWSGDLDREVFLRSEGDDGECILRLSHAPGGKARVRIIEPEYLCEPTNTRSLEDYINCFEPSCWRFGVHTLADDVQTVLGYYVHWDKRNAADYDYFPASEIEHIKCNVRQNVKRGLSGYYPVLRWLDKAAKLLGNTADGAALQAAIAFIIEGAQGMTQASATTMASQNATLRSETRADGGTNQYYERKYKGGTVPMVSAGYQYKPGPMGAERAQHFILIEQAVLRLIGARFSMPEYMISGDASNANFSSTLVAESPFVKACLHKQAWYKNKFLRIIWKAVKVACEAGRLSQWVSSYDELERLVDIKAEPPRVEVRNKLEEAQIRGMDIQAGILSKKTASSQAGLVYEDEQRNNAEDVDNFGIMNPTPIMPDDPRFGPQLQGDASAQAFFNGGDGPVGEARLKENCGIGDGGFEAGNDCAKGGGGGGGGESSGGKSGGSDEVTDPPDMQAETFLHEFSTPDTSAAGGERVYKAAKDRANSWAKGESQDAALDHLYDETQKHFAENGIESVTASRGVSLPSDHPIAQAVLSGKLKPGDRFILEESEGGISSWSESTNAASKFALNGTIDKPGSVGIVLTRNIPAKNVLTSHRTRKELSDLGEREIVATSKSGGQYVVRIEAVHRGTAGFKEAKAAGGKLSLDLSEFADQRGIAKPDEGDCECPPGEECDC